MTLYIDHHFPPDTVYFPALPGDSAGKAKLSISGAIPPTHLSWLHSLMCTNITKSCSCVTS